MNLKLSKWSSGLVVLSYISNYGILKCFGNGSCIIRAPKYGSIMKPKPSSLGGASPRKASTHHVSSWSFQSTLAFLLSCTSKGYGGEWTGVDHSSNQGEGEHLLASMGLSGVAGGICSCHSMPHRREILHRSKCTPTKGVRVCGGMAWPTWGCSVIAMP